MGVAKCHMINFSVTSWREHVTFNEMMMIALYWTQLCVWRESNEI